MKIKTPLILDGAMGTQLQKAGMPRGVCPETWILEHPDIVRRIQNSYIEAGSQVIYAPTFGANSLALEKHGITGKTQEYNLRLVALSREIAEGRALVAGDISSTGGMLYPMGQLRFEQMYEVYLEQARALQKAGVDLFVIETMTQVAEARAAVLAVKEVSDLPVFVSFSCDAAGRSMMGTDAVAALVILQKMGIDAFGLNCSQGPEEMTAQIRRLREIAEVPLIAKPNAGLPVVRDGETAFSVGPEEFAFFAGRLFEAGASILGGCCGTEADHIRGICSALESHTFCIAPGPSEENCEGRLACATEKDAFFLSPEVSIETYLSCGEELEDELCELERGEIVAVRIATEEDIQTFADIQYCMKNPLCICCNDSRLLEKALRLFQGRALYEGSLGMEVLKPLQEKYGLILF